MEERSGPVAGIDYPRNFEEFNRRFADEAACRSYIFGFAGPKDANVNDVVPKSRLGLLREAICIVNDLPKHGYKHSKTVLSDTGDPAHVAMPGTPNRVAVEAMATLHSPGSCQR